MFIFDFCHSPPPDHSSLSPPFILYASHPPPPPPPLPPLGLTVFLLLPLLQKPTFIFWLFSWLFPSLVSLSSSLKLSPLPLLSSSPPFFFLLIPLLHLNCQPLILHFLLARSLSVSPSLLSLLFTVLPFLLILCICAGPLPQRLGRVEEITPILREWVAPNGPPPWSSRPFATWPGPAS